MAVIIGEKCIFFMSLPYCDSSSLKNGRPVFYQLILEQTSTVKNIEEIWTKLNPIAIFISGECHEKVT